MARSTHICPPVASHSTVWDLYGLVGSATGVHWPLLVTVAVQPAAHQRSVQMVCSTSRLDCVKPASDGALAHV